MILRVLGVASLAAVGSAYYFGKCEFKYIGNSACPDTNTYTKYTFNKPAHAFLGYLDIKDAYVPTDGETKVYFKLAREVRQ